MWDGVAFARGSIDQGSSGAMRCVLGIQHSARDILAGTLAARLGSGARCGLLCRPGGVAQLLADGRQLAL